MRSIRQVNWQLAASRLALAVVFALTTATDPAQAEQPVVSKTMPTDADTLSLGGRLYDNHWNVIGKQPPQTIHPVFPKNLKTSSARTWRCSSCHGWDYLGRDGHLGRQSQSYTLKSLARLRERDPGAVAQFIGSGFHKQITSVLSPQQLAAISAFVTQGQHEIDAALDRNNQARGDRDKGKAFFETHCIRCHEADGRAFIYGEEGDLPSLGWLARKRPAQALHKIRNGVPKADMLSLRTLPLADVADLLAYLQTLDPKAP